MYKNIITSCKISSILYDNIFVISLLFPLEKRAWSCSTANLNSFYPRSLRPMYFWNWSSGSAAEDSSKFTKHFRYYLLSDRTGRFILPIMNPLHPEMFRAKFG